MVNIVDTATALPTAEEITTDDGNTTSFSGQELALSCGEWVADDEGIRHLIKRVKVSLTFGLRPYQLCH